MRDIPWMHLSRIGFVKKPFRLLLRRQMCVEDKGSGVTGAEERARRRPCCPRTEGSYRSYCLELRSRYSHHNSPAIWNIHKDTPDVKLIIGAKTMEKLLFL